MVNFTESQLQVPSQRSINGRSRSAGVSGSRALSRSPNLVASDDLESGFLNNKGQFGRSTAADERRHAHRRQLYACLDSKISALFGDAGDVSEHHDVHERTQDDVGAAADRMDVDSVKTHVTPKRKAARAIDEDDYGDEDEEDDDLGTISSPLQSRGVLPKLGESIIASQGTPKSSLISQQRRSGSTTDHAKTSDDARKKLDAEKKEAEAIVKESFHNMFFTLENDRDAMLEQQKLDELDRQVETDLSGQGGGSDVVGRTNGLPQQGTLSSTNLGSSSLTLKHLIMRIDAKRTMVQASDLQLRSLMSEVRKNRSKWASEDKVGQEELYESAEKVLMELKAMTEWAGPFLSKVSKRDAPDYHIHVKNPMDIGTMLKKLKQVQYKSKKEFVGDLELIWKNCEAYNKDPASVLRKKAEHMRRETARLTPLIPDIVIRDRAEVEAEDRRREAAEFDAEDAEESDEEPIIASRGRKAPSKKSKKGGTGPARNTEPDDGDDATPAPESRLGAHGLPNAVSNLKHEFLRSDAESVTEGSQHGFSTPPPGNMTPLRLNGVQSSAAHGDTSEFDGPTALSIGAQDQVEDPDQEDEEYKMWKQVTKKDRAQVAAERNRLFKADRINPEEPALLRSKAGMRRWLRHQSSAVPDASLDAVGVDNVNEGPDQAQASTLAEGMDAEEERVLPDYYDPLSAIPQMSEGLRWQEDGRGQVIENKEECLRIIAPRQFISPQGALPSKIEANMRQMQDTRKITAKIGVVKQMQLQAQTYQNQFQKYDPEPFVETDIDTQVVSDEGPIIAPILCRAALQRSVAKIFYHAGFEEFQPSALEAMTETAADFFQRLVHTFCVYQEAPRVYEAKPEVVVFPGSIVAKQALLKPQMLSMEPNLKTTVKILKPRFTFEERILHTLHENGLDLDVLESYIKDDVERLSSKLDAQHGRMRDYLAELLRPAFDTAAVGTDGAGAFNDGSEQFVGGDFAEDIDEDFFGFKELGLDKEFGLASLSVPLHLLQSRVHNAYQPTNVNAVSGIGQIMEPPSPYPALTSETLEGQIGLVKEFFRAKLTANDDDPLVEDEELPAKQRFPKPRLPPTGKISSPRKRPIREQQMMARKKRKLELEEQRERDRDREESALNGVGGAGENGGAGVINGVPRLTNGMSTGDDAKNAIALDGLDKGTTTITTTDTQAKKTLKPISKLKFELPPKRAADDDEDVGDPEKTGLLSPESMALAVH